ncbi:MAG: hypothetical protein ACMG6S_10370 [Byssovorax sp.]
MTEDEITERLQAGGLKLAFDTNAVEDDPRTSRLRNKIEQWNATLASRKLARVRLIACALVHHEKVFHLKQEWGHKFNPNIIVKALKARGWQIDPYEMRHALATGEWIGNAYPTESAWHLAKKEHSLRSLGLDKLEVAGTGRRCGTTVDWLIIGHARAEGCVLVSDDMGPEFAGLVERVKLETLERALEKLASEAS